MRQLLAAALLALAAGASAAPMGRMGLSPMQAPVGSPLVAAPLKVSLSQGSIPLLPASAVPGASTPLSAPSVAPALRPDAPAAAALPQIAPEAPAESQIIVPGLSRMPRLEGAPLAALPSLERLAERLAKPKADQASFSERFFDNGAPRGPPSGEQSSGRARKLPEGVVSVDVDEAVTPEDIDALIPAGQNSDELKDQLKRKVARLGPIPIHTFHDAVGGIFTGIDLSQKPSLVDHIPELQPHEKVLIKKLQLVTKDIQVLVREDGKTPDLVMGGRVTELKSLIGREVSLEFLVNKANKQVVEHSKRHRLGHGDAALDLTEDETVPVDEVLTMLNAWQARTANVSLDRIWVFSKTDSRLIERGSDGLYRVEGPSGAGVALQGRQGKSSKPSPARGR